MPDVPRRILFLRSDGYRDLVLFEPVLRLLKAAWPATGIAVLIPAAKKDLTRMIGADVRWLTTGCVPHREGPDANPAALRDLRETVLEFAPDCLVAASYDKTWLETFVGLTVRDARQISLGPYEIDLISRAHLGEELAVDRFDVYPEAVAVDPASPDWEKNRALAWHLVGDRLPMERPSLSIPLAAQQQADEILRSEGLHEKPFLVCSPGDAALEAWPDDGYAEVLHSLQGKRDLPALLVGHEREREVLVRIRERAIREGATPAVWTGKDGELPVLGALVERSRLYLGGDSAPMHVAAALDRPVVAVVGGGHHPRFAPVARRAAVVVQPLPCFGCGWQCDFGDAPCVKTIPAGDVLKGLELILAGQDGVKEVRVAGHFADAELDLMTKVADVSRNRRSARVRERISRMNPPFHPALVTLVRQLRLSEADRAARLEVIHRQGENLGSLREELARRFEEVRRISVAALEAASENADLRCQVNDLNQHFANAEADRASRLEVIHQQGADIGKLQEELRTWFEEVRRISVVAFEASSENAALKLQLADLEQHFANSEADRAARLEVIHQQAEEIARAQQELHQALQHGGVLANGVELLERELDRLREDPRAGKKRVPR